MNSPLMKTFGDQRIAEGERVLVVDLADCSGMDSTFMGTLAGLAARLSAADDGTLQIAGADERNRRSLEDLGLDFLMQINPADAGWHGHVDEIRSKLKPAKTASGMAQDQRARHVLQAHQVLSGVNHKNAREFENVVGMLKKQVADKPQSEP